MNTIIRVIWSSLSVIILSRVAALHWCHCRAVNASLIATSANVTHRQREEHRRLSDSRSACKTPPKNFLFFLYFHSLLSSVRKKKKQARNDPYCVFITTPYIITFGILYALPKRNFLLPSLQFQQLRGAPGVARGYVHMIQGWFHRYDRMEEPIWAPRTENLTGRWLTCQLHLSCSPLYFDRQKPLWDT